MCDLRQLVRARMSTGSGSARAALDTFDGMTEQESEAFLSNMIKWEKAHAVHDVAATKISFIWTGIFSMRENKKEERSTLC